MLLPSQPPLLGLEFKRSPLCFASPHFLNPALPVALGSGGTAPGQALFPSFPQSLASKSNFCPVKASGRVRLLETSSLY